MAEHPRRQDVVHTLADEFGRRAIVETRVGGVHPAEATVPIDVGQQHRRGFTDELKVPLAGGEFVLRSNDGRHIDERCHGAARAAVVVEQRFGVPEFDDRTAVVEAQLKQHVTLRLTQCGGALEGKFFAGDFVVSAGAEDTEIHRPLVGWSGLRQVLVLRAAQHLIRMGAPCDRLAAGIVRDPHGGGHSAEYGGEFVAAEGRQTDCGFVARRDQQHRGDG
ncbi:MAG: hypothetical protein QM770_00920 [Tepidisphaeraceae bacterium]